MALAIRGSGWAAPLLWLGLVKIARTPTPRLAVAYRLVGLSSAERGHCVNSETSIRCEPAPAQEFGGLRHPQALDRWVGWGLRPLGEALYLDRLLAGGIVGEVLPLANLMIEHDSQPCLGGQMDVVV